MRNLKRTAIALFLLLTLLCVVGCDVGYDIKVDGLPYGGVDELCINGVVYYSGLKRLAVGFNTDSTVKVCDI